MKLQEIPDPAIAAPCEEPGCSVAMRLVPIEYEIIRFAGYPDIRAFIRLEPSVSQGLRPGCRMRPHGHVPYESLVNSLIEPEYCFVARRSSKTIEGAYGH